MVTVFFSFLVSHLVGVPQAKTYADLHHIFKMCLPLKDLKLITFWEVSGNNCCHGNTLKFCSLKDFDLSGPVLTKGLTEGLGLNLRPLS